MVSERARDARGRWREIMRKVWVLDTSTKGTGATMVPLDRVLRKPAEHAEPMFVPPAPGPQPHAAPAPRPPRRFRVVDIVSRQVLTEDADAREVLDVLGGVRSIVDVNVYVWQPQAQTWRLLTFGERRLLWDSRGDAERSVTAPA
jgi:hypothetical protein